MVCVGDTVCVPDVATWPSPTIDTFVASVVFHVSIELPPGVIVFGVGGDRRHRRRCGCRRCGRRRRRRIFLVASCDSVSNAARLAATARDCAFRISSRVSPPLRSVSRVFTRAKRTCTSVRKISGSHFQLQFGIVLLPPPWVSCC